MSGLENNPALDPFESRALDVYELVRQRKFDAVVNIYDELLQERPDRADLWVNRGVALQGQSKLQEAADSFTQALAVREDDVGALINRAAVYNWMGRYHESLADCDRAVELEPDNELARIGRAATYGCLDDFSGIIKDCSHVLSLNPAQGNAYFNLSFPSFSMGDYLEGFRLHEWRFGTEHSMGLYPYREPLWFGEQTTKTILLYCEQGLGDGIQFMRYIPMMKAQGLNVIIESPKALVRLFERFGYPVVPYDSPKPKYDLQCPIMRLGAIYKTTLDTIPCTEGYLTADPSRWRDKLSHLRGLKVGLSWVSGAWHDQPRTLAMQRRKSIYDINPLWGLEGVSFVSLQKEVPRTGIPKWIFHPMDEVKDFQDTADLISALDLVVAVDSAVAHMAGALAKPVWVLNRFDICWRWLSGGVESPWYKSGRIFRQTEPMKWDDVLEEVRTALTALSRTQAAV